MCCREEIYIGAVDDYKKYKHFVIVYAIIVSALLSGGSTCIYLHLADTLYCWLSVIMGAGLLAGSIGGLFILITVSAFTKRTRSIHSLPVINV
jgi:hypothetical protein